MRYGSVCSGIEAATVAWHPLGWQAEFFAEIEPFPCAVLQHRWPGVPNLGDITKFHDWQIQPGTIDLFVGGTPCQSFSVAGLRKGLADPRGNLALVFLGIVDRLRPRWVVWENVPGILSSAEGRDFGAFLGALGQLGYGWAYRILDAQYFRVPQRRRRVFVVGYLGAWQPAAAVLFERHGLSGDSPPRRKTRQGIAGGVAPSLTNSGRGVERTGDSRGQDPVIPCLRSNNYNNSDPGMESQMLVASPLRSENGHFRGFQDGAQDNLITCEADGISGAVSHKWHKGTGGPAGNEHYNLIAESSIPILEAGARTGKSTDDPRCGIGVGETDSPMFTLQGGKQHAVAFEPRAFESRFARNGRGAPDDVVPSLKAQSGESGKGDTAPLVVFKPSHFTRDKDGAPDDVTPPLSKEADRGDQESVLMHGYTVRRLTPRECERLQGFPDDHTLIPWKGKPAADSPRYKALGNSMAVPVMRWIGERIAAAEAVLRGAAVPPKTSADATPVEDSANGVDWQQSGGGVKASVKRSA